MERVQTAEAVTDVLCPRVFVKLMLHSLCLSELVKTQPAVFAKEVEDAG